MTVRIRPAVPQDYEALLPLFEEIDALHRQHHPERFQEPAGPARERAYLLATLADEQQQFLVVEAGGGLVGFVHVILQEVPPIPIVRPRRLAQIDAIVVKATHRGQGLGRLLMTQAEAWANAQGAASIELGVYEFNHEAQEFYQGLGYTAVYRRMSKNLKAQQ